MKLSIIILNYKTPQLTSNCIESIQHLYKDKLKENLLEVIVLENGSNDKSVSILSNLKSKILNLTIIESKENLGFGNGCNFAALSAKGEYLLFLNSDTKILDEGFLKMSEFLDNNPKIGVLGGKLKNPNGSAQASAGEEYSLFNVALWLFGFERIGMVKKDYSSIQKVSWVSGACMMIRRSVFEKIGGFEKELFMYMEDVDICFRAKKHGFDTYFFPDIDLAHAERGSSNRTFAILNIYKGLLFFFRKRKPYWQYLTVSFLLKAKAFMLTIVGLMIGNSYLKNTYSQALRA